MADQQCILAAKKKVFYLSYCSFYTFSFNKKLAAHKYEMYLILWEGLSIHGPLQGNLLGHGPLDGQCDARMGIHEIHTLLTNNYDNKQWPLLSSCSFMDINSRCEKLLSSSKWNEVVMCFCF